ncbi:hypothetical protein CEXT_694851 [Caerostris extrusa]|uniref:Uncharacterized protein n=1 Tax=Caerostris extrusa TaxID=172846 RepID=A0AAV4QDB3_CAEEX|nr:hypothetical protein CEXT_694851 [Caerostris extrusa]
MPPSDGIYSLRPFSGAIFPPVCVCLLKEKEQPAFFRNEYHNAKFSSFFTKTVLITLPKEKQASLNQPHTFLSGNIAFAEKVIKSVLTRSDSKNYLKDSRTESMSPSDGIYSLRPFSGVIFPPVCVCLLKEEEPAF